MWICSALSIAAMTSGNRVYPMIQTDWKKELLLLMPRSPLCLSWVTTHMLPPNNLICSVTTASPIQMMANTPEKTPDRWESCARKDSRKLSRRQKSKGPLVVMSASGGLDGLSWTYHRSQSRSPSLMPPCKTVSGQRPTISLSPFAPPA